MNSLVPEPTINIELTVEMENNSKIDTISVDDDNNNSSNISVDNNNNNNETNPQEIYVNKINNYTYTYSNLLKQCAIFALFIILSGCAFVSVPTNSIYDCFEGNYIASFVLMPIACFMGSLAIPRIYEAAFGVSIPYILLLPGTCVGVVGVTVFGVFGIYPIPYVVVLGFIVLYGIGLPLGYRFVSKHRAANTTLQPLKHRKSFRKARLKPKSSVALLTAFSLVACMFFVVTLATTSAFKRLSGWRQTMLGFVFPIIKMIFFQFIDAVWVKKFDSGAKLGDSGYYCVEFIGVLFQTSIISSSDGVQGLIGLVGVDILVNMFSIIRLCDTYFHYRKIIRSKICSPNNVDNWNNIEYARLRIVGRIGAAEIIDIIVPLEYVILTIILYNSQEYHHNSWKDFNMSAEAYEFTITVLLCIIPLHTFELWLNQLLITKYYNIDQCKLISHNFKYIGVIIGVIISLNILVLTLKNQHFGADLSFQFDWIGKC